MYLLLPNLVIKYCWSYKYSSGALYSMYRTMGGEYGSVSTNSSDPLTRVRRTLSTEHCALYRVIQLSSFFISNVGRLPWYLMSWSYFTPYTPLNCVSTGPLLPLSATWRAPSHRLTFSHEESDTQSLALFY